ncbi:uncharacterized protein BP5553_07222 [Venustampulla echinocandica]|uniref:Uncharacterized protein n=1 Tax=Venustampulla echinocandica TaxID=2656787 RepID=A0A370TIV4_9HELO|nr:uncharacterized protein BP5553_07222 [Venustampulla echinocandica]RDL35291.1 hypothetical protein BP5553_07222 [Venustampulla echinocandica]
MRHDIVSFDTITNKIYLACNITYVVAQDPENKEVTVPAMGVAYLLSEEEASGKGNAVLERFDVYLDFSPVLARTEEVKKSLEKTGELQQDELQSRREAPLFLPPSILTGQLPTRLLRGYFLLLRNSFTLTPTLYSSIKVYSTDPREPFSALYLSALSISLYTLRARRIQPQIKASNFSPLPSMVILEDPDGRIEVCLRNLVEGDRSPLYFGEYMPLGECPEASTDVTRHIVPEDTSFAVEVTFKKGFRHGEFRDRIWIKIGDKASGLTFARILLDGSLEKAALAEDKVYCVKCIPEAIVNCQPRKDVQMAFYSLAPVPFRVETRNYNVNCKELGGLEIVLERHRTFTSELGSDRALSLEKEAPHESIFFRPEQLPKMKGINQNLFYSEGITHAVSLTGGTLGGGKFARQPAYFYEPGTVKTYSWHFIARAAEYLKKEALLRTPIRLYCEPWSYIDESSRERCFKDLQERDMVNTFQLKLYQAGPGVDPSAVRRQLFSKPQIHDRWKLWCTLNPSETETMFSNLQSSLGCFKKRQISPEYEINNKTQKRPLSIEAGPLDADSGPEILSDAPDMATSSNNSPQQGPKLQHVVILKFSDNMKLQRILGRLPNPGKGMHEDSAEQSHKRRQPNSHASNTEIGEADADIVMGEIKGDGDAEFQTLQDKENELDEELVVVEERLSELKRKEEILRVKRETKAKIAAAKQHKRSGTGEM